MSTTNMQPNSILAAFTARPQDIETVEMFTDSYGDHWTSADPSCLATVTDGRRRESDRLTPWEETYVATAVPWAHPFHNRRSTDNAST